MKAGTRIVQDLNYHSHLWVVGIRQFILTLKYTSFGNPSTIFPLSNQYPVISFHSQSWSCVQYKYLKLTYYSDFSCFLLFQRINPRSMNIAVKHLNIWMMQTYIIVKFVCFVVLHLHHHKPIHKNKRKLFWIFVFVYVLLT